MEDENCSLALLVSELIESVQRADEALKNRKERKAVFGGISDGKRLSYCCIWTNTDSPKAYSKSELMKIQLVE